MTIYTDFLVVGSGIGGLSFALEIAQKYPQKKILIITKTEEDETNTKYAQGGIAAVLDLSLDSFQKHIQDTQIAGDGLCNSSVVELVVNKAPQAIQRITELGVQFDKNKNGTYSLGKEGGHSENRILHFKDMTGKEMERALLEACKSFPNIEFYKNLFSIDILTQHHLGYLITKSSLDIHCFGIYALDLKLKKVIKIIANYTIFATGGGGQVYKSTTNPVIATGDGVALFYRAKGRVENMEFIQFHPTALYDKNISSSAFLITEAIRGEGAILKNMEGETFMKKYDSREELAPRDIVARAIDFEMKRTGSEFVYLDCTSFTQEIWREHFPTIFQTCQAKGINVLKDYIPIVPAAHYSCGGIKTNAYGETSIKNLYACGECASTGLHGANRLASNSLLEALVFAHQIATHISEKNLFEKIEDNFPDWKSEGTTEPSEMILITQSKKELQSIMSDYVGIVRTDIRLQRAMNRLDLLFEETEKLYEATKMSPQLSELRNMITFSYLIVKSAQFRKESRGLHFNTDYPNKAKLIQNSIL